MKIQQQDIYHGAALTQIVEHPSFKALNRVDEKYGHYLVNHDKRIFIKYRTNEPSSWQFTFQPHELKALKTDIKSGFDVYLCLICGLYTVCAINSEQIETLISLSSSLSQSIRVDVPEGGSMWLQGSIGPLKRSIPHNSFPNIIFESIDMD